MKVRKSILELPLGLMVAWLALVAIKAQDEFGEPLQLAAGEWAPQVRLPAGETSGASRTAFLFRSRGRGGVRALLSDPSGDPRSSSMYVLLLPGSSGSGALLRCSMLKRIQRRRGWRWSEWGDDQEGLLAVPDGDVAVLGLPGGQQRACALAMQFGSDPETWSDEDCNNGWRRGRWWSRECRRTRAQAVDRRADVEVYRGRVRIWLDGVLYQWTDVQSFDVVFLQVGALQDETVLRLQKNRFQPHWVDSNTFCIMTKTCACQRGYRGDFCTELCPTGRWGASCAKECGHCLGGDDGTCDPFTGACPLGCEAGFLPPNCTKELARLAAPPVVKALNSTALEVWAPVLGVFGSGVPIAAVVEYRPTVGIWSGKALAWRSLPPQPLRNGASGPEVRCTIGGLRPGASYQVRVLLRTTSDVANPQSRTPTAGNFTLCAGERRADTLYIRCTG